MNVSDFFRAFVLCPTLFTCTSCEADQTSHRAKTTDLQKSKDTNPEVDLESEKDSIFRKDKEGILWFERGTDGETPFSSTLVLSDKIDGIAIVVVSNEKNLAKAVGLAVKMKNALQADERTPNKIPIVVSKDDKPGVGYAFYTDGMRFSIDDTGVYSPVEAKTKLKSVITQHVLLKQRVTKGEWGHEFDKLKQLQIISH